MKTKKKNKKNKIHHHEFRVEEYRMLTFWVIMIFYPVLYVAFFACLSWLNIFSAALLLVVGIYIWVRCTYMTEKIKAERELSPRDMRLVRVCKYPMFIGPILMVIAVATAFPSVVILIMLVSYFILICKSIDDLKKKGCRNDDTLPIIPWKFWHLF